MRTAGLPYIPIFNRSYFSLLEGILSPEEICRRAAEQAYPGVGMVDSSFYGLIRFLNAAYKYRLKALCGVEVFYKGEAQFIAYCLNQRGFIRICRLISRLNQSREVLDPRGLADHAVYRAYNPLLDIAENGWEGLAIVSARRDVLASLQQKGQKKDAQGGLYAALLYGTEYRPTACWARERGIPLLALNRRLYKTEEERELILLLRAIDLCKLKSELPVSESPGQHEAPVTEQEMKSFFSAVPEALVNAYRLWEESDTSGIVHENYVFPRFGGLKAEDSFARLRSLCREGVSRRYGELREEVKTRLDYELSIIQKKGFADYFLVVHDIVKRSPRTCGRGSSAASIVSFLLGITHVDPLKYNLFFERFLNMGRKDPPDIDVDFPWDEREKALDYVFSAYKGHAAMVADYVTFGPRSSIREPAKALGVEEREIGRFVAMWRTGRTEQIPPEFVNLARKIKSIPRYIGTHPGGVIITPEPITNYTHIQISPLARPVIAWDKDSAEDAGLVKIDLLGNRSLGVLRDSIELVNRKRKEPIKWERFQPTEDAETRKFIESGETMGIFYIESPATRQLLRKMERGDYPHLVLASSIIRPAANRYINEYVERLKGKPYTALLPSIEETLVESQGIMVYQEDVSRVAIAVAGFSAAEADGLRKVLSRKDREQRLGAYRDRFFAGGKGAGIEVAVLKELWDMILSFDGYSFCKSHSASYALVSYKLAYLKLNYPLEFLCSVINNGGGFYGRQVYLNLVRRLGFEVRGPDVNRSALLYSVEASALRIGLRQIKELSDSFLLRLIEEREEGGPYESIRDFVRRLRPAYREMRMLIRSGALDSLAGTLSRPQLFWYFVQIEKQDAKDELFSFSPQPPDCIKDYREITKIHDEIKTLGLIISRHPLKVFTSRIEKLRNSDAAYPYISSREISSYQGKRVSIPGIMVTGKEVLTKKREAMSFVSFEDPEGVFETVFFPKAYEELELLLDAGRAFVVSGLVKEELGAYAVHVEGLRPLNRNA